MRALGLLIQRAGDTAWSIWHVLTQGTVELGNVQWHPPYLAGVALLGMGFGLHFVPDRVRRVAESRKKNAHMGAAGWIGAVVLSTWTPGTQMRPFIYWQF